MAAPTTPSWIVCYNRYSYVLNNPLKYVDHSGKIIFTLAALLIPGGEVFLPMAIQADIGWITGGLSSKARGGSFLEGAFVGGVIGAINGGRLNGLNAGFNIFTGDPGSGTTNLLQGPNGTFNGPNANKYRLGAAYIGYGGYRIGYNSERNVRAPIQNGFRNLFNYPHFLVLDKKDRFYGGFYSSNPYTLW